MNDKPLSTIYRLIEGLKSQPDWLDMTEQQRNILIVSQAICSVYTDEDWENVLNG